MSALPPEVRLREAAPPEAASARVRVVYGSRSPSGNPKPR